MPAALHSFKCRTMPSRVHRRAAVNVSIGLAAALCINWIAFRLHFNLSSATSVHLLLVTILALRWGFFEASVVSLLSVACLDYFFTDPLFQLYIADSHDWVALLTFESVALLVSRLSNQVTRHATATEVHGANLQKLYELSQGILLLEGQKSTGQHLAALISACLKLKGVALWNVYDLRTSVQGDCDVTEQEMRSIYFNEISQDDSITGSSRRVLRSGTRPMGSLLLAGHTLDPASINATASLISVAIERARSFSAESNAEAARQGEQLRSAILDGLAHSFKTPLTTIRSCSSGLLEMNRLTGTEKRLVALMDREIGRLDELTTRALRTARLDSSTLRPKRERLLVLEVLQESIAESNAELGDRAVTIEISATGKVLWADKQLVKMALCQLLDNAAKYGTPGTPITVDILEEDAEILIAVRNHGSFIPQAEQEKIFTRFYRMPGSNLKASGTGIGLSVVKQVTEAHHGRAWVSSDTQAGTVFFLGLPRPANEEE